MNLCCFMCWLLEIKINEKNLSNAFTFPVCRRREMDWIFLFCYMHIHTNAIPYSCRTVCENGFKRVHYIHCVARVANQILLIRKTSLHIKCWRYFFNLMGFFYMTPFKDVQYGHTIKLNSFIQYRNDCSQKKLAI